MLSVTPHELMDVLLTIATVRPVFIWGPPGVGKSSLVEQFAARLGLPCVSLLGSQLAPEDIIGVPQIENGKSFFCPPRMIARDEPYVLFLDELNACTPEVQKAFYSLIHDRRIGEYDMPKGSVVVGAGNRKQDRALARPIASALVNRLIHIELQANTDQWLIWGEANGIHPLILGYLRARPDHILATQAKDDAPFSTPRSWHMLSDALYQYAEEDLKTQTIQVLASGCLSTQHAGQFAAFARNWFAPYTPEQILSGEEPLPFGNHEEVTFRLASVRAYLIDKLPSEQTQLNEETEWLLWRAVDLIEKIAEADAELVRFLMTPENEDHLPAWFVAEVTKMWADILQIPEPPAEPAPNPFRRPFGSRFGNATPPADPNANSTSEAEDNSRPAPRFFRRGGDNDNPFGNAETSEEKPAPPRFGSSPFRRGEPAEEKPIPSGFGSRLRRPENAEDAPPPARPENPFRRTSSEEADNASPFSRPTPPASPFSRFRRPAEGE